MDNSGVEVMKPSPLAQAEREKFNSTRAGYLEFFRKNGIRFADNNLSKPYLNGLSPGCRTCIDGRWGCFFVNHLCSRSCFFCPQDRKDRIEQPLKNTEGQVLGGDAFFDYLNRNKFKGLGFSGGEPLLSFPYLVNLLKKISEYYRGRYYTWIYTNGDLLDEQKLSALKVAGLNEIRIDAAARDYDMGPVKLARRYFDNVTLEFPAIPEDKDKVICLLDEFEEMGVTFMNIHQLMASRFNFNELKKRDYSFVDIKGLVVVESEFAAYEILKQAAIRRSRIGINVCTKIFKDRFQTRGQKFRLIDMYGDNGSAITDSGNVRKLRQIVNSRTGLVKRIEIDYRIPYLGEDGKSCRYDNEYKTLPDKREALLFSLLFIQKLSADQAEKELVRQFPDDTRLTITEIMAFQEEFSEFELMPNDLSNN